jgi:hypothetical protein
VEFDFARSAECHDVTPPDRIKQYPDQRLIEVRLPVSVRFSGVSPDDVEELGIEINGAGTGLRVHSFSPPTQLASDLTQEIERTTTTKKEHSLDATLGGALPVPNAELVANVLPSINAATSHCETSTEKVNRLSPKYAVVVSGSLSEGCGVFFKLKRSSQTSLEGIHDLTVVFVAPVEWQRGEARVACSARGRRKVLCFKQLTTLGRAADTVQLHMACELCRSRNRRADVPHD